MRQKVFRFFLIFLKSLVSRVKPKNVKWGPCRLFEHSVTKYKKMKGYPSEKFKKSKVTAILCVFLREAPTKNATQIMIFLTNYMWAENNKITFWDFELHQYDVNSI